MAEEEWWGPGGLKTELGTRYATSMYLIFNGLENGYTDTEKYFAIFSELIVSSLIYGGMAALMTESLTEANESEKDFNERFSALKAWMTERRLQKSYINKVLNYYSHKYKDSVIYDQAELLKELPPAMAASLMKELYGDVVAKIPFFHDLDDVVITKLSSLAKPLKVHQGQPIIEEGKTGLEMYILIEGECLVEKGGIQLGILNVPGSYFGELPIVNSRDRNSETRQRTVKGMSPRYHRISRQVCGSGPHHSDLRPLLRSCCVVAVTDCDLIYLDQEDVLYLSENNPALKERLVRFARLGKRKTKTKGMAEDWVRRLYTLG
jgi:CRP-like cAMP-binding protein